MRFGNTVKLRANSLVTILEKGIASFLTAVIVPNEYGIQRLSRPRLRIIIEITGKAQILTYPYRSQQCR